MALGWHRTILLLMGISGILKTCFISCALGAEVKVDIYKLEFTKFIVVHLCNAIWLTERGVWIKICGRLS